VKLLQVQPTSWPIYFPKSSFVVEAARRGKCCQNKITSRTFVGNKSPNIQAGILKIKSTTIQKPTTMYQEHVHAVVSTHSELQLGASAVIDPIFVGIR
jgi:hypothetical protein